MNLKRRIRILICCLAVMGMFSVGALAQAASCTHPRYVDNYDAFYDYYVNANGHYTVDGTEHICTTCGYSYWTNLKTTKTNHEWSVSIVEGEFISGNECRICGWKR